MGLDLIYYGAIFCVAVFLAPTNRLAALIVILWCLGKFAILLGAEPGYVHIIQHVSGLLVATFLIRSEWTIPPVLMFLPMIASDILAFLPGYEDIAWWALFLASLLQLVLLLPGIEWRRVRARWRRHSRPTPAAIDRPPLP